MIKHIIAAILIIAIVLFVSVHTMQPDFIGYYQGTCDGDMDCMREYPELGNY